MESLPSFFASDLDCLYLQLNSFKDVKEIKSILLKYYYDFELQIDITKQRKGFDIYINKISKLVLENSYISNMQNTEFNINFVRIRRFAPIHIPTINNPYNEYNIKSILKYFILNPQEEFTKDMYFSELKFLNLKYIKDLKINKEELNKILTYARCLDRSKYVGPERLRYGKLLGITDFRIGKTLYSVKYKYTFAKQHFYQMYIYSYILKKFKIDINQIIIITLLSGFEYVMKIGSYEMIKTDIEKYKK